MDQQKSKFEEIAKQMEAAEKLNLSKHDANKQHFDDKSMDIYSLIEKERKYRLLEKQQLEGKIAEICNDLKILHKNKMDKDSEFEKISKLINERVVFDSDLSYDMINPKEREQKD